MTMMTPPPLDVRLLAQSPPLSSFVAGDLSIAAVWFLLDLSADLCASIFAAGGRGDAGPAPRVHRGTPAHGRYSLFVILV
ncbi:hypothetical protein BHM03_00003998 [Ensete ventricosum]|nr:hypothetical protein BHM03_00003998 [Ensete ventricosum]